MRTSHELRPAKRAARRRCRLSQQQRQPDHVAASAGRPKNQAKISQNCNSQYLRVIPLFVFLSFFFLLSLLAQTSDCQFRLSPEFRRRASSSFRSNNDYSSGGGGGGGSSLSSLGQDEDHFMRISSRKQSHNLDYEPEHDEDDDDNDEQWPPPRMTKRPARMSPGRSNSWLMNRFEDLDDRRELSTRLKSQTSKSMTSELGDYANFDEDSQQEDEEFGSRSGALDALAGGQSAQKSTTTTTSSPSDKRQRLRTNIKKLTETSGKKVESKRNSTIIINGRKFDQVHPVECVDNDFYETLMKDLNLIEVANWEQDSYESYYDAERAKAISSVLETPVSHRSWPFLPPLTDGTPKPLATTPIPRQVSGTSPSATAGVVIVPSHLLLNEVKRFWRETNETYTRTVERLNLARYLGRKRRRRRGTGDDFEKPRHQRAMENHNYLMRRIEELKMMLLNGEESLIILNNKVKKLKQAAGEQDLERALGNCVASRAGRAALMLINELFIDKDAMKVIKDTKRAQQKAKAAATDTAEFCSYWYGDTIRAQSIIKEKQIKRLVKQMSTIQSVRFNTSVKVLETSSVELVTRDGNTTKVINYEQTKVRFVNKMAEMTDLWLPELSNWIKQMLGDRFRVDIKPANKPKESTTTTTSTPTDQPSSKQKANKGKSKRSASSDDVDVPFSTPFDSQRLYSDVDDGDQFEGSDILQSFIAYNYGRLIRRKREPTPSSKSTSRSPATPKATGTSKSTTTTKPQSTTTANANHTISGTKKSVASTSKTTTRKPSKETETTTTSTKRLPVMGTTTKRPIKVPGMSSTTPSLASASTSTQRPQRAVKGTKFELKISELTQNCSIDGFVWLLDIAYDQNALLYETTRIKKDNDYIRTLKETFTSHFASSWIEKRDEWAQKFASSKSVTTTTRDESGNKTKAIKGPSSSSSSSSVDEHIEESLEPTGSGYERGAQLGFTLGKFVGDKAARQWPDPVELNTFTYDSLFLAGVAHGYDEAESVKLEQLIVTETAKRVAFTEANRRAFAKGLHTAYLNGAFVVPKYGILHGQRAVAKRAQVEGAQVGYEAASAAASEFAPKAKKFFNLHEHQRQLAAPYKSGSQSKTTTTTTTTTSTTKKPGNQTAVNTLERALASQEQRVKEMKWESQLNRNISSIALDCGQKSGALMGTLLALIVVPEAFETYARVGGSIEGLRQEFYQYKLGALRGYELGESWAILNYTTEMARNLESMRDDIGKLNLASNDSTKTTKIPKDKTTTASSSTSTSTKAPNNKLILPRDNFATMNYVSEPTKTNVNNIFQFMVTNYGPQLIANHTSKSMLSLRSLVELDDNLLMDMKIQSKDLIGDLKLAQQELDDRVRQHKNKYDDPFNESIHLAGQLEGELSVIKTGNITENKRIKFEIIDLGPMLEFADEIKASSAPSAASLASDQLDTIPLTVAVSKVDKLFIKVRVARGKTRAKRDNNKDELERYLNLDQYDSADGFLCGALNKLHPSSSSSSSPDNNGQQQNKTSGSRKETRDDLDLEAVILDELFERIEHADKNVVAMTETVMSAATTVAPRPLGSDKDATPTTRRAQPLSTTTTPTTSTSAKVTSKPATTAPTTTTTTTRKMTSTGKPVSSPSRRPHSSIKPTPASGRATTSSAPITATATRKASPPVSSSDEAITGSSRSSLNLAEGEEQSGESEESDSEVKVSTRAPTEVAPSKERPQSRSSSINSEEGVEAVNRTAQIDDNDNNDTDGDESQDNTTPSASTPDETKEEE